MRNLSLAALVGLLAACQPSSPEQRSETPQTPAPPAGPAVGTPEWKIESATSAAPAAIGSNATVLDWPAEEGGEMAQLRAGTNGWTCMPDMPDTPADDPMCLDGPWMAWAAGWMSRTEPDVKGLGLAYMLQGGSDASNTDPYATEPDPATGWIMSGPHVMIVVPDPAMLDGMTTDHTSGGPYVMWKGTPYAHVMMPVK
jgi:hypothetical protein